MNAYEWVGVAAYTLTTSMIAFVLVRIMVFKYESLYGCIKNYPDDYARPSLVSASHKKELFLLTLALVAPILALNLLPLNILTIILLPVFISIALSFAIFDAKYMIIPDISLILLGAVSIVAIMLHTLEYGSMELAMNALKGMLIGGLFPIFINKIATKKMGFGDVKMFAAMGILAGSLGIMYTMLGAWLLQLIAFFYLVDKVHRGKASLPLAPFAVVAYIVTLCVVGS